MATAIAQNISFLPWLTKPLGACSPLRRQVKEVESSDFWYFNFINLRYKNKQLLNFSPKNIDWL